MQSQTKLNLEYFRNSLHLKSKSTITRKSFHYKYSETKIVTIDFDIVQVSGKKLVQNITMTSNWCSYIAKHPELALDDRGKFGFYVDGTYIWNGDYQQMIKRIIQIVDETEDGSDKSLLSVPIWTDIHSKRRDDST